jgi:hypothetical protein
VFSPHVALRVHDDIGIPDQYSVAAQWLACSFPRQRFSQRLATPDARLEDSVDRYSFTVTTFTLCSLRLSALHAKYTTPLY